MGLAVACSDPRGPGRVGTVPLWNRPPRWSLAPLRCGERMSADTTVSPGNLSPAALVPRTHGLTRIVPPLPTATKRVPFHATPLMEST